MNYKLIYIVLMFVQLGACSSLGTMHTARPIPEDTFEFSFCVESIVRTANAPEASLEKDENGEDEYRSFDETLFPMRDVLQPFIPRRTVQFRYGVTSWFDAGVKLYPLGARLDANFLLYDGVHLAISLDPEVEHMLDTGNYGRDENDGSFVTRIFTFWLPVLLDVYHTKRMTMTVAAKGGLLMGLKGVDKNVDGKIEEEIVETGFAPLVGASVGWKVRLSDKRNLLPEVAAVYDFKNRAVHIAILIGWAFEFKV